MAEVREVVDDLEEKMKKTILTSILSGLFGGYILYMLVPESPTAVIISTNSIMVLVGVYMDAWKNDLWRTK